MLHNFKKNLDFPINLSLSSQLFKLTFINVANFFEPLQHFLRKFSVRFAQGAQEANNLLYNKVFPIFSIKYQKIFKHPQENHKKALSSIN